MRILLLAAVTFFVACGSTPQSSGSASENDTTTSSGTSTNASGDNSLTDAEKAEGWTLLFDGQTKTGWHSYLNKTNLDSWKVQDGMLTLDPKGTGGGSILTDQEFENYHLKVDWKISKNGNSGIIFNVKEDQQYESDYYTGPEMQVLDNEGHPDAKINKHRAGDLYDLISATPETVKPAGEWNTAEIIIQNDSLELRLNGPAVVKTKLWDDNWKQMIANSKFKDWSAFGTIKSGKISLQDHGDQVWYKNIKIRKL
jgi:hypothetical protein